jgi:uncharacterized membrane protein HdeD (DUF308 family)
MIRDITRNWWAFVLQGVLAIAVGVATFVAPQPSLTAFIAVFAIYALVTGLFEVIGGLSMPTGPKWSLVAGGVLAIAIGVLTFAQPQNTAVAVTLLVAVFAIATGVGQVSAAYTLRSLGNTFWLGLSGVVSVVFGVLLISQPNTGVLAVLWLIGFYAIFAGILSIAFGIQLKSMGNDVDDLEAKVNAALGGATSTTGSSPSSTTGTGTGSTTGSTSAAGN